FDIEYVAQHSSRDLPLYLKASAVWGGQDGSLLLWASLQALFGALVLARPSREAEPLVPWATVFMSLITAFFVAVTLFLSNPFAQTQAAPMDGQGLNPLLRHPGMIFHPPALYLGYVGLAVPFALGLAALVSRKIEGWSAAARPWTLAAWLFLGLGLLLGMRWAYDVLGWGGYWGWDPVENAGLMPWLTATALVHALVMQDQRRSFRWWSVTLAMLSFLLVLFGTFTTRSGLIQSVHAFARSRLGPYFLAAMGVTLVGSLVLFYSRRRLLSTDDSSGALLSREGMFTLTLVLLLTLTGSIMIGSVLPTLTEALAGGRFEAGPAWFDRVTGPQFGALVLVMGVCPLLGRAAGALRRLRRDGVPTLVGGFVVPVIGVLAGFTRPFSVAGFAIIGLAGGTALAEIARGVSSRMNHGASILRALWDTFGRNRRRYAGYLVHLGIIVMAVGVIGTRFYPFETEVVLTPGESVEVQDYTLVFDDLDRGTGGNPVTTLASVSVYRDERRLRSLRPSLDQYSDYQQTMAVPAVRTGLREDLYLVLAGWSGAESRVTLKVFVNPLASFLWLGGLVFMAGGAIALWPGPVSARLPAPEARRRRAWSLAGVTVGLILVALAAWAMWGNPGATAASSGLTGHEGDAPAAQMGGRPRVGELAPDISVDLLDGGSFGLSDLDNQVAVINFWSPDCQPCLDELPGLQTVWESYRSERVLFVGISLPELEVDVRKTISKFGLSYPMALDNRAPAQYAITGVPETFIVGPDGNVAYVHIGPLKAGRLREELDAVLGR
ncbi:MAG: cytochrome c-type biogenesis CcmF C-terminal domain-containing protein, partial [Anaerolineae bacterium]